MEYNPVFNMPAEFDPLIPPEIGGFSDQEWWDPSCLFDGPTEPLVPPTHFLADGNTVVQPPQPPPVLDHVVYNSKSTMPDSDLPPTTNQEDYSLTDQEWCHVYDVPTQPPKNHLLADGNSTVQPLPPLPPPQPAHSSKTTIPALSNLPTPPTLTREEYSMTDQEWCDFRLEGSIDAYDELECAFIDLLERMAATIRKISSMPPTSLESRMVALPAKVPQASNSPEFHPVEEAQVSSLGQGKKKNHWTDKEHKLFLEGLKVYGDGDWINIARDYVKTRTHIQIASHAQKYYLRQHSNGSGNTKRKRKSIHDITTDHIPNPNRRRCT